jgi:hypothetical protein
VEKVMQKGQEPKIDKSMDLPDLNKLIEDKKEESMIPSEMEAMLSDLNGDHKINDVVNDLFYKSVKNMFDLGFELAEKLNLELISSFKLDEEKDKE